MSELGSGSTPRSSYPGSIDTNTTNEVDSPSSNKTLITAAKIEDGYAAIINLQTELGTDPAGTKSDVKTFLQTEHNADGTHTSTGTGSFVRANSPTLTGTVTIDKLSASGGVDAGASGVYFKTKVIEIGDWNMDATSTATVAHGLTLANIRSIRVIIQNDDGNTVNNLNVDNSTAQGGYWTAGATNVTLSRITSGLYDGVSYDATSYNRGWIVIDYV